MTKKLIPQVGERYGRLTITEVVGQRPTGTTGVLRWIVDCACECGASLTTVLYANLRGGNTRSCGCWKRERIQAANTKHGATASTATPTDKALWSVWKAMTQRCRGDWPHYVNVSVCARWVHDFGAFRDWAISAGYAKGLTLDRLDNTRNYAPTNCRWATPKQQARNRKTNRLVEFEGEIKCVAEWADDPRCIVPAHVLHSRLQGDWPMMRAMSTPVRLPPTHTYAGETKRIYEWAKDPRSRVDAGVLRSRLRRGWSLEEALVTPLEEEIYHAGSEVADSVTVVPPCH